MKNGGSFHSYASLPEGNLPRSIPVFQPRLMVLRLMLQFIKRGSDDHDAELEAGAVDRATGKSAAAAGRDEHRCAHDDEFYCPFFVQISLIYIYI